MTVSEFVKRWRRNEGGAERANYALFLTELCTILDLPHPDPAGATHEHNDYVFERAVEFKDETGKVGRGRIDLYRRGSFVLEAKQSRWTGGQKEVDVPVVQGHLPGIEVPERRGRRSAHHGWDVLMRNAREQAEQYARALPTSHGWPPFVITCDVGHAFEIFADFSGQGKNYRQFPDRAGYRIYLDDLPRAEVRDLLRAIWLDPHSLDPTRRAAAVTRDIAERLAVVSQSLEKRSYPPEKVAHFLMRCLFTMFAEDTGLLDRGSFAEVLSDARANPDSFAPLIEELWRAMDRGGFSAALRRNIRRFNGGLFAERTAIPLRKEEINELYEAAKHDWTQVEPAIFGTLLEQALDPVERRRLGAHYTPRAYVERLVVATIIAPLRDEWEVQVLGTVERERAENPQEAINAVQNFHKKLADTRVLDPACGTGNFLYVALELMKQLEGDVLEVLTDLGGEAPLEMNTISVHPRNFLGLELNPRAAAIAELVLWLGYLQWQMRNGGVISDPVLERLDNISVMDAIVLYDQERAKKDGSGTELNNPRCPTWPEADYIVGNPPFMGGKDIRARLGENYLAALCAVYPRINRSADLVMYWWDRAAQILTCKGSRLKRFGLVTTNSITQEFSRRVMQNHMNSAPPLSLVMAIPDHPWTRATKEAAAVRIAMTVAEPGIKTGHIYKVVRETGLTSDIPEIIAEGQIGQINANLTLGTDLTRVDPLLSNKWLCSRGVSLHGAGFIVTESEAETLGLSQRDGLRQHIRPYRNGRDLTGRSRSMMVIDLFGLAEAEVRSRFPEVYQHLLRTVKPDRSVNNRASYRDSWWIFGEPRRELRPALKELTRYIATVETAKHRVFQFLDTCILPDNMLVAIGSGDPFLLGVLSSRIHTEWALKAGGWLGFGNDSRYSKSKVFDPYPAPNATSYQRIHIGALAEELDATRKAVLAEHSDLTLTALYNMRAKLLQGDPLDLVERSQLTRGRVDIINELHDQLDAAVAAAYGWPRDMSNEEIVTRIVALNAERVDEERRGIVRWLRPDYQQTKAAAVSPERKPASIEIVMPAGRTVKPLFPRDPIGQTAAALADLRAGFGSADDLAVRYKQGRRVSRRIDATLQALTRLGYVAKEGRQYKLRRAA